MPPSRLRTRNRIGLTEHWKRGERESAYVRSGPIASISQCNRHVRLIHKSRHLASIGVSGKGQKRTSTVATNATALAENGATFRSEEWSRYR